MKILLVNPPIYDFTAYDFWLRPYGMLSIAGWLGGRADFKLFDYLARADYANDRDNFHRGPFAHQNIPKPLPLKNIPRRYNRFGLSRESFRHFLKQNSGAEFAFIQTGMTYWYPGVAEVINDIKEVSPNTKIVLGGPYATICPEHAKSLGADLIIQAADLGPLWQFIGIEPDLSQPPLWELYDDLKVGAIKLTAGCPCRCTYCFVSKYFPDFKTRPPETCIAELNSMLRLGVTDIAFYDDALLHRPDETLIPFLSYIIENKIEINLHTPNAVHARLLKPEIAKLMVAAGFKTFYLGYESSSDNFQKNTGSKLNAGDLAAAVENLLTAGACKKNIVAYEILGHPHSDIQNIEASMRYANSLGIKIMLADFSPIPGTPDGEYCRKFVDLDEPLNHNKTAFPYIMLGENKVNRIKQLCKQLNRAVS